MVLCVPGGKKAHWSADMDPEKVLGLSFNVQIAHLMLNILLFFNFTDTFLSFLKL